MRIDTAVGSVCDAHSCRNGLGEPLALCVGGLAVLAHRVSRPAIAGADLVDVVTVVDIGHEVGAVLSHHRDRLVIHQRAVLDTANTSTNRTLDALCPMCMGGHKHAVEVCLFDSCTDLRLGELAGTRGRAFGEHRTGGNHLDEFGTTLDDATDGIAHLVHIASDSIAEFTGNTLIHIDGEATHITAPTWHSDERSGALHSRSENPARVDGIAQCNVRQGMEGAHISNGGETGSDGVPGIAHPGESLACSGGGHHACIAVTRFELPDHMGMTVDESGQNELIAEVDNWNPLGHAVTDRGDARDLIPSKVNRLLVPYLAGDHIHQRTGQDDGGNGAAHDRDPS